MKLPAAPVLIGGAAVLGLALVALLVWRKGGAAGAGASVGAAAVQAVGGVASGAVGAVGASVGLPSPDETITDPAQVRYIIDGWGYFAASKWAGAPALFAAIGMPAGSGKAPPANSPALKALGPPDTPPQAPATAPPTPAQLNRPSAWAWGADASFADLSGPDPYADPFRLTP